jgi:hypothetical protein
VCSVSREIAEEVRNLKNYHVGILEIKISIEDLNSAMGILKY